MLYQLGTTIDFLIIILDFVVVGLLLYLLRHPRSAAFHKWLAVAGVVLLILPLAGFKLLRSSPGMVASTPGLVVIRNPEQRVTKLYYVRQYPQQNWRVVWVEYVLGSDAETVLETEGAYGLQVAYQRAGQWQYAPVHFSGLIQSEINFPQDFAAVDQSGRIAAAVSRYALTEGVSWLSHLLTLGSLGLLLVLFSRFVYRLVRPRQLGTAA